MIKKIKRELNLYLFSLVILILFIVIFFYFKTNNTNNSDSEDTDFDDGLFYIAINQKGASNDNNGLYPYFKSDHDGPFMDLNFDKSKLPKNKPFKIILGGGNYKVPDNGFHIYQSGNINEYIIISNFRNEKVIIDGDNKDIALKIDGSYIKVENLEIRNSKLYNIQVKENNIIIQNNIIHDSYEDNIKVLTTASDILIENNEIYDFSKEGIDVFGSNVKITNNYIHSGKKVFTGNKESHCFLAKGGSENVLFNNNKCEDVDSDWGGAVILGGVSGTKYTLKDKNGSYYPQGRNISVINNTFNHIRGGAASFIECIGCAFNYNTVNDALWGYKFVSGPNFDTEDATVIDNYIKILGNGYIALIEEPSEIREFDYNTYFVSRARYLLRGKSEYEESAEQSRQVVSSFVRNISQDELDSKGYEKNSTYL